MISEKDLKFFKEVSEYFKKTRSEKDPEGSINDTALHFEINRNKVRKILVTTGSIKNEITEEALKLKNSGLSIRKIAEILGVSEATVSTYLPYDKTVKSTLDPTDHTAKVRQYRAYEKRHFARQVQNNIETEKEISQDISWKDEWISEVKLSYKKDRSRPQRTTWEDRLEKNDQLIVEDPYLKKVFAQMKDQREILLKTYHELSNKSDLSSKEEIILAKAERSLGFFPGVLADRNRDELEKLSGERLPYQPSDVVRLHLELVGEYHRDDMEIIQKFGNLKGEAISRDVIVPYDIPLYALHYLIQRLFGWQNSHLHKFFLSDEKTKELIKDRADYFKKLCGIIFRDPDMSENDEFWADNYERGSFKNWLTRKYTGPYQSRCCGESYPLCQQSMKYYKDDEPFYVSYIRYKDEEVIVNCYRVYNHDKTKNDPPNINVSADEETRYEVVMFKDLPLRALELFFFHDIKVLIERLPLFAVLLPIDSKEDLTDSDKQLKQLKNKMTSLIRNHNYEPESQPLTSPFTRDLFYEYDFGDSWNIRITSTYNCTDLMDRISQDQLDKASIKCRELYRPVTLLADGDCLLDDVGGISGYAFFLKTVNPDLEGMDEYERHDALKEKREYLAWSKWLGWKKLSPFI